MLVKAVEKHELLEKFGARVERVRPASIVHPQHYVNVLILCYIPDTGVMLLLCVYVCVCMCVCVFACILCKFFPSNSEIFEQLGGSATCC